MKKIIIINGWLIVIVLCLLGESIFAKNIIYNNPSQTINPAPYVKILEDPEHCFSIEEILHSKDIPFQESDGKNLNFKHTKSKFWIDFEIENCTSERLILLQMNPMIQYLNVHIINENGEMRTIESGAFLPHETRSLKSSVFSFDLGRDPTRVLLEASTYSDFHFILSISTPIPTIEFLHKFDLFNGFFFGVLIALLLYHLFILIKVPDRAYLWYILYFAVMTVIFLRIKGVGFDLIWQNTPQLNGGSSIPHGLVLLFSALFAISFLELKKYSKLGYYYLGIYIVVLSILLLGVPLFKWYNFTNRSFHFISIILGISELILSIFVFYKGHKAAIYYTLAWSSANILTPIVSAVTQGYIEPNFITLNLDRIGIMAMAILMSNALAYKYGKAKKDALEKAEENERLIKEQNIILEKKVALRTEQLNKVNDRLLKINQMKDRIFAILGHDLRKPTIAFRGISKKVNYLVKKQDFETLEKFGNEIEQEALSLNKLTDNLLNWALAQKSVLPYNPDEINLSESVQSSFNLFKNVAANKKIKLIQSVPNDLEVYADANALSTIIRNLLDNAIKYTPENGQVEVKALSTNEVVKIEVIDSGIGMNREQMKDIFLLKKDKSTPGTIGEKGTGLGLHLIRELVDLNQGEISVESEPGKGTTFGILLPKRKLRVA